MNENTDPGESLAASEIGYFGYFTSNRIIDTDGLIMPKESNQARIRGWDQCMSFYKPDYFVRAAKVESLRRNRVVFRDLEYRRVRLFRSSKDGNDYVLFRKRGRRESRADS